MGVLPGSDETLMLLLVSAPFFIMYVWKEGVSGQGFAGIKACSFLCIRVTSSLSCSFLVFE